MDATTPLDPDAQRKQDRARKRKAILAGGVVLGLGAAVTLAAWSDNVFSEGTFNTGSFDLVGSNSDAAVLAVGDYQDWPGPASTEANVADLSFEINALNMSPGETVAAPFSIAQKAATTIDGRVWMYQATATGTLTPFLSYAIKPVDNPALCKADDPATGTVELFPAAATAAWNAYDFDDGAVNNTNNAGQRGPSPATATQDLPVNKNFTQQQHLCIQVTLAQDEPGISAVDRTLPTRIVWQFRGESETPTS